MRYFYLNYENTGSFGVEVMPEGNIFSYKFNLNYVVNYFKNKPYLLYKDSNNKYIKIKPKSVVKNSNGFFARGFKSLITEYTFIICIPVAFWMAEKINERWHDDRED